MAVVLGTLTIDLKANTASFSQSMDKMSHLSGKTANDVKRSLERIAAAGIAMGLAVATGVTALIKHSLDAADRLDELAESAGTTADTLSALGYAAKFSSVDTEELSKTLVKLSKSAFAAQNGNEELRRVFKRLGVDVESSKGHLKDSGVLFEELAPAFSKMADGAGKSAIALLLLGKSGAASIPILNQLGETQGRLTEEARQFGLVISGDTARGAGEVNDNLDRLKAVFNGLANSLLAATLPALLKLSERLVQVAKEANIPDLAKSFGSSVASAIEKVGIALEFAVKHAHALKIAIEALLALQVAKFAIPFAVELLSSGKLVAGVGRLSASLLGIGRLIPVLAQFSAWLVYTTRFVGLLAAEEGIAAAATYVFGGALAVLSAPVTIVVGAIAALSAGMYYFRDSTFHAKGEVYKLRDAYTALWQIMMFQTPHGEKTFNDALVRIKKEREAAEKAAAAPAATPSIPHVKPLATPDTGDFALPKKDVYGEEIKKLDLAIAAQQAYLAVLGASPEKIAAAASAERAEGIILEKNTMLIDEHRAKLTGKQEATIRDKVAVEDATKALVEYGRSIVGDQQSTDLSIRQQTALTAVVSQSEEAIRKTSVENAILALTYGKTAEEVQRMGGELTKLAELLAQKADTEGLAAFAKSIDDQRRSLVLSTEQTEALAAAQLLGEEAVREATESNAALALTYGRTAEEIRKLKTETDELALLQKRKAAADRLDAANAAVFGLRQDLASRAGLPAAILQGEDAYRKAALAAKLYGIEQRINAEEVGSKVRESLELQRRAIIDITKAELAEGDARDALALRSTGDKYREDTDALRRQVDALTEGGKRTLTYGEAQQVAAKQQDILNRAIDDQVALLNRSGSARDGMTAFFLDMQKQAKSTASIIYDALTSAFQKVSDNLTNLLTGGKTNFGQAFKDVGKQIIGDTVKSNLQKGLGALGAKFGIEIPKGKPDGTEDNPLWIRMKRTATIGGSSSNDGSGPLTDAVTKALHGKFGSPSDLIFHNNDPARSKAPGVFSSLLQSLFGAAVGAAAGAAAGGGGGGSPRESVTSWIWYRAGGGPVSPNQAYMVGEHGREILAGASGRVINNSQTERLMGPAQGDHYYSIDARGTDPVLTEQRTRVAIMAAHNSAVTTGMQVHQEHLKRTPQR
jgi:hypothetical protein